MNGTHRTGGLRMWTVLAGFGIALLLVGTALAAEAAHGGHGGIDLAKLQELLWRTVNFVIFAAVLIKLASKPIKKLFAQRSDEVAATLEELEAKQAEADQAVKAAEARLAEVAIERDKIIQQYMAEGELEKGKILEKANLVAARLKEMAALTIDQETKKASQNLREEVVGLATQLATNMIKEKATYADQQGLVEEYLKKVGDTR
jgi:F-type H+-transporting ATPase subunit b